MIISLGEIPNCFAIWEGGSETLPYSRRGAYRIVNYNFPYQHKKRAFCKARFFWGYSIIPQRRWR